MLRTYCSARRSSCVPIRFLLQGIFFSYHPSQVFLGNFLTEIKEQIKTNKTAKSETGTSSPNPLLNPKEAFLWGYLGLDKRMKNNSNVRSNWHSSLSHSLQNKSFSKSMPQNFQNTHQFQSSFISVNILHIPGLVSWAMKDLLSATLVSSSRLQSILVKTARMYFKKKNEIKIFSSASNPPIAFQCTQNKSKPSQHSLQGAIWSGFTPTIPTSASSKAPTHSQLAIHICFDSISWLSPLPTQGLCTGHSLSLKSSHLRFENGWLLLVILLSVFFKDDLPNLPVETVAGNLSLTTLFYFTFSTCHYLIHCLIYLTLLSI